MHDSTKVTPTTLPATVETGTTYIATTTPTVTPSLGIPVVDDRPRFIVILDRLLDNKYVGWFYVPRKTYDRYGLLSKRHLIQPIGLVIGTFALLVFAVSNLAISRLGAMVLVAGFALTCLAWIPRGIEQWCIVDPHKRRRYAWRAKLSHELDNVRRWVWSHSGRELRKAMNVYTLGIRLMQISVPIILLAVVVPNGSTEEEPERGWFEVNKPAATAPQAPAGDLTDPSDVPTVPAPATAEATDPTADVAPSPVPEPSAAATKRKVQVPLDEDVDVAPPASGPTGSPDDSSDDGAGQGDGINRGNVLIPSGGDGDGSGTDIGNDVENGTETGTGDTDTVTGDDDGTTGTDTGTGDSADDNVDDSVRLGPGDVQQGPAESSGDGADVAPAGSSSGDTSSVTDVGVAEVVTIPEG